jgi:hypothetical protein
MTGCCTKSGSRSVDDATVCALPIKGMPDDVTPLAALVVLKALDADGDVAYYARATDSLTTVEAIGMAVYAETVMTNSLDAD